MVVLRLLHSAQISRFGIFRSTSIMRKITWNVVYTTSDFLFLPSFIVNVSISCLSQHTPYKPLDMNENEQKQRYQCRSSGECANDRCNRKPTRYTRKSAPGKKTLDLALSCHCFGPEPETAANPTCIAPKT